MRKEYYRQHREEILAKNRAWKKAHPEVLSEWEAKNRAKRTEQKRRWKDEHREDVQNTNKAYVKSHTEIVKNGNKKWRNKNPEKLIHYKTPGLIRAGVLVKAERCYFCDATKNLVAHHQDYQKPTEVVWLCRSCHSKLHVLKQNRPRVDCVDKDLIRGSLTISISQMKLAYSPRDILDSLMADWKRKFIDALREAGVEVEDV